MALATVISQCISACSGDPLPGEEQGAIHLDLHSLRFHKVKCGRFCQVGLPAGVQGILFSLSNVVIPGIHQRLRRNRHGRQLRRQQH